MGMGVMRQLVEGEWSSFQGIDQKAEKIKQFIQYPYSYGK